MTELCAGTLLELVDGQCQGPAGGDREVMYQITSGVKYLHDNKIVHRDLKPGNILVSFPDEKSGGHPVMKITDFGSSRQLSKDNNETLLFERSETGEYSTVFKPFGTHGWNGPEYVDGTKHYSYWIDIFPLGCIFGFILTKGGHPFSNFKFKDWKNTNEVENVVGRINDKQQEMLLKRDDIPNEEDHELIELIGKMLNKSNPENRPTAADILKHSYFQSFTKGLFPAITGYVTHFKSRLIYITMK